MNIRITIIALSVSLCSLGTILHAEIKKNGLESSIKTPEIIEECLGEITFTNETHDIILARISFERLEKDKSWSKSKEEKNLEKKRKERKKRLCDENWHSGSSWKKYWNAIKGSSQIFVSPEENALIEFPKGAPIEKIEIISMSEDSEDSKNNSKIFNDESITEIKSFTDFYITRDKNGEFSLETAVERNRRDRTVGGQSSSSDKLSNQKARESLRLRN